MRNQSGLSLLEVLIASAILAVMGVGFIQGFTVLANEAGHAREKLQAALLAEDLREEMLSKPSSDPDQPPMFAPSGDDSIRGIGREPGEYGNVRVYLDDRDDYADLEDRPVTDLKGNPIPGMEKFSRIVRIRRVMEDEPAKDAGDRPSRMRLYAVIVKKADVEVYRLEWLEAGL